jgi:hypothetical protein
MNIIDTTSTSGLTLVVTQTTVMAAPSMVVKQAC